MKFPDRGAAAAAALLFFGAACLTSAQETPARAEPSAEEIGEFIESFGWQREGVGELGSQATLKIPEGYRFSGVSGTLKLLELYGNLTSGDELGLIAPESLGWFVVFEFDPVGYVPDDEKDSLDADEMMAQKKELSEESNRLRQGQGLPQLELVGWAVPPHYDAQTNNLEWGLRLRDEAGEETLNYSMKLLGRRGVMDATLVCGAGELDALLPAVRRLMEGFAFREGEGYAEYRAGDKVAEYGLTALVVGGGAALAAKSGLLGALAKFFGKGLKLFIAAGILAVAAAGRFWRKIFRREPKGG